MLKKMGCAIGKRILAKNENGQDTDNNQASSNSQGAGGGAGGGKQVVSMDEVGDFSKIQEDPRMPLNVRQIFKITKSWKAIARTMSRTGTIMFVNLFEQNEDLLSLFTRFQHLKGNKRLQESMELQEHAATVMRTLDQSINSLNNYDNFVTYLHQIGELHRKVPGFRKSYFWQIEQPFLKAVKQTLDERCNETIEQIYILAIKLIIQTIMDGYGDDPDSDNVPPSYTDATGGNPPKPGGQGGNNNNNNNSNNKNNQNTSSNFRGSGSGSDQSGNNNDNMKDSRTGKTRNVMSNFNNRDYHQQQQLEQQQQNQYHQHQYQNGGFEDENNLNLFSLLARQQQQQDAIINSANSYNEQRQQAATGPIGAEQEKHCYNNIINHPSLLESSEFNHKLEKENDAKNSSTNCEINNTSYNRPKQDENRGTSVMLKNKFNPPPSGGTQPKCPLFFQNFSPSNEEQQNCHNSNNTNYCKHPVKILSTDSYNAPRKERPSCPFSQHSNNNRTTTTLNQDSCRMPATMTTEDCDIGQHESSINDSNSATPATVFT